MEKVHSYGPINPDPSCSDQNEKLLEILRFIEQTLNLGFWKTKEELKEILDETLKIMQPHEDILATNYEKAQVPSQENNLMIKCKMQCIVIIKSLIDYAFDLEVKRISKIFSKYKLPKG